MTRQPCGVDLSCKAEGVMSILPSGHLRVKWQLYTAYDGKWRKYTPQQTRILDPSGFGRESFQFPNLHDGRGDPQKYLYSDDPLPPEFSGPAGENVTLNAPGEAGGFVDGLKRVWYFGDGTSTDGGVGNGPAPSVTHVYERAGSYPGTLVYYILDNYAGVPRWHPVVSRPFHVQVG
jgi:hypothetical protein